MLRRIALPVLVALTVAPMASACAPRIIEKIVGTESQVKLLYSRRMPFAAQTGIVQCDRAADGSLSNCRDLPIVFEKP